MSGKFYRYFPLKWSFLGAIFVFEMGSLICAVAPDSTTFVVGRAIAGVGSAGVVTGAFTMAAFAAEPKRRPALMGLVGAVYGLSSVVGPLLGGVFADKVSWRWWYVDLSDKGSAQRLIMVQLLHQSSYRRRLRGTDPVHLQDSTTSRDHQGDLERKVSADGSSRHCTRHGRHRYIHLSTRKRRPKASLEQQLRHRAIGGLLRHRDDLHRVGGFQWRALNASTSASPRTNSMAAVCLHLLLFLGISRLAILPSHLFPERRQSQRDQLGCAQSTDGSRNGIGQHR
jgi:hypothetical protein